MKKDKLKLKPLLKGTKFATFDSGNKQDFFIEKSIALLIVNGKSFDELFGFLPLIENKKDNKEIKTKAINVILDFISLNPDYAEILKQNDKALEFLNNLGYNF
jgi:hypothetical protein